MKAKYLLFAILIVFISTTLIAQPVQESGYDPGAARNDLSNVESATLKEVVESANVVATDPSAARSDLSNVDPSTARTAIDVYSKTETDSKIPKNASFTLTDLSDVPDIAGNSDKFLKLNTSGDAFEWGVGGLSELSVFADIDDATIATGAGTGYGATAWGGAVVMSNNKIITTMQRAENYVIYDPSTNICTNKYYGYGDWKFQGNGLVIGNKVYFCPNAWSNIGIYNVDTDAMSLSSSVGGDNQYTSLCKITDDLILLVPGTNYYFKEYTISTNVASQTGFKGAYTQYMFTSGYYVESVDKVILSPRCIGNIGIYNVTDKTYSSGVALTGLGHNNSSDAFCGIYNGTGTNELLFMPNYVTKVCAYNYVSNTIRVVYNTGLAASTFTRSFQLSDGRIFLYGATKTAIYNPEDNTFDLGPEFDTSGFGGAAEVDGRIAFIPNASSTVKLIDLKYSIYNEGYKIFDSNNDGENSGLVADMLASKTIVLATDTGTIGSIRYDSDYIYVCVATDTWKRAEITTW